MAEDSHKLRDKNIDVKSEVSRSQPGMFNIHRPDVTLTPDQHKGRMPGSLPDEAQKGKEFVIKNHEQRIKNNWPAPSGKA